MVYQKIRRVDWKQVSVVECRSWQEHLTFSSSLSFYTAIKFVTFCREDDRSCPQILSQCVSTSCLLYWSIINELPY